MKTGAHIDPKYISFNQSLPRGLQSATIRLIENLTGRIKVLRLAQKHANQPALPGNFWKQALTRMGVDNEVSPEALARIPKTGPLVVFANHPHGLVDGMVLCNNISRVRSDFKILTRPFLTKLEEINPHMMPVAYNHEPDAIEKNIQMHKDAIAHVRGGGCLILFPAGAVARAKSWWGDAKEMEWTTFMARLILRGNATALPMYFNTRNSRWFQMAAQFSDTARQGLLMHEIARSFGTTMRPVVGQPISHTAFQGMGLKMPEMTRKLYDMTMALAHSPDGDALPAELELPRAAE
ncbi:MAG: lysophospholipid acyltransferase family protein [Paracoccaceae bacterium]